MHIKMPKHTQMPESSIIQRKQNAYISSIPHVQYDSLIDINIYREMEYRQQHLSVDEEFTHNQLCRCNVPPNHRPACSSISQQRCHPRAGHDSPRIRVNYRLTHILGDINNKPTQLGFTGFQQPSQANTVQRLTIALRQLLSCLNRANEF